MRYLLSLLLCCVVLSSCRSLDSESGLYDVKLNHNFKIPVDGGWTWGKGNPFSGQRAGSIYVAPMDISLVEKSEPEYAPLLRAQMHGYIVMELSDVLAEGNRNNGTNWRVTDNPNGADIRVDVALVHFKPQRPGMKLFSTFGGSLVKVPGVTNVVGHLAEGDVCIEATVRNNRNGELLMAVKDSNRKKARLYTAEAYSRVGNADVNLRAWAHKLAALCRESFPDKLGNTTLKRKLEERSWWEVAKDYIFD